MTSLGVTTISAGPRPTKEIPFKKIIVRVLAPVMLEIHRHAEPQINAHVLAQIMPERGHGRQAVVNIGIRFHISLVIRIPEAEIEEIKTELRLTFVSRRGCML